MLTWLRSSRWPRVKVLRAALLAPVTAVIAACSKDEGRPVADGGAQTQPGAGQATAAAGTTATPNRAAAAQATQPPGVQALPPTPQCADDEDPTPAQTEGPYFTPNSPERTSLLEPGLAGARLALSGYVLDTNCRPVARALVDFWQADDLGAYDNAGYRLRGHQFTDADGRYTLETVMPGLYPGRTRHIHVKVQAPNRRVLTTQLYFPDEQRNSRDGIFRPELVVEMQRGAGDAATFTFVLDV